MTEPARSPRMELLLTAALHVVAEHGLRGLTHRAVDREAGLPEGSCSAYLRTRKALVLALTQYVADSLAEDVEQLAADLTTCALGDDQAVEAVTGVLHALAGRARAAAGADGAVAGGGPRPGAGGAAGRRSAARLVGLVESILSARGKDQGDALAETLVASFDGVLLGALEPAREPAAAVRRASRWRC